jgi:hypothetical protein
MWAGDQCRALVNVVMHLNGAIGLLLQNYSHYLHKIGLNTSKINVTELLQILRINLRVAKFLNCLDLLPVTYYSR